MRRLFLILLLAFTASAGDRFNFPYIYKYGGNQTHMRSHGDDIETMVRRSKQWSGEYVWLRRNGQEYLIRDASVLAQVRAAFADMHAFEPKLRAAEQRRDPWERKMEAIEERLDRLSDQLDDDSLSDARRDEIEERLRVAERELQDIEDDYLAVEREAERLEREMDRLEAIAEKKFERIVIDAIEEGRAERVR